MNDLDKNNLEMMAFFGAMKRAKYEPKIIKKLQKRRESSDKRGAGGNVASGYRTIRKGGIIKFDQQVFQADFLKKFIGSRVWVYDPEDIWYSSKVRIRHDDFGDLGFAINIKEK